MAMGSPGDMSYLPTSSSWGLPTSFDFSQNNVPQAILILIVAAIGAMIVLHLMR
jgi:uncharacterized membrane protein YeaQ/YmgE (transglycosylase-associated protein family)